MKKLATKKIMTSKEGGEFVLPMLVGDLFVSFHLSSGECLGYFLAASEFNSGAITEIYNTANDYFKKKIQEVHIKIIGKRSIITKTEDFFKTKNLSNIKLVPKFEKIEVMFLPNVNKVRVSNPVLKTPAHKKIKILIVDDSKTIQKILEKIFLTDSQFEVCAMADKPSEVEALIIKHQPDVITLDIHMPEMDGVTLLKILAPKYKIPTVMISSISIAEGPLVLEALENGAIDYIQKPEATVIEALTPMIVEKIKIAANSRSTSTSVSKRPTVVQTKSACNTDALIVLGASTGGTEAIRVVLLGLPSNIPPILIVQHIPAVFSLAFAKRMNEICPFEVKEAQDGDEIKMNRVLIAPGGKQMKMIHKNGKAFVEINDEAPVNRFKPSVDYLFQSVVKNLYCHTIGVLLTGMGKDGAKGLLELKQNGVTTIAQDEKSCVVFGMPREAISMGGATHVESIENVAEKICLISNESRSVRKAKIG